MSKKRLLLEHIGKCLMLRNVCRVSALAKVFVSLGLFVILFSSNIENCYADNRQYKERKGSSITPTSNSRVGRHSGMTSEQAWAFLENEKILGSTREGRLAKFHRDSTPYSRDVTKEAVEKGFGSSYLDDDVVAPEQITHLKSYRSSAQDIIMMIIVIINILLLLSFIVGLIGVRRNIGFIKSLLFSLFLTPIIGLVITLCSERNDKKIFTEEKNI